MPSSQEPPSGEQQPPAPPSGEQQPPAPPSGEQQPPAPPSGEQQPPAPPSGELERRRGVINDIGSWKRTFLKIPVRRLTPQELTEALQLDQIKSDYLNGKPVSYNSLRNELPPIEPVEPRDPLDKYRILATLIMVIALFAIVAVIVFNKTPPSGIAQLVSLASGLAGIGLGWLFGAASARGKK